MSTQVDETALFTKADQTALHNLIKRFPEKMPVLNPKPRYDNEGARDTRGNEEVKRLLTEPRVVVAGPPLEDPGKGGRVPAIIARDDSELLKRTAHVRGKKEALMPFYARTGLGPTQILQMSKDEITRFVAVVSQHEQVVAPRYVSIPDKFVPRDDDELNVLPEMPPW